MRRQVQPTLINSLDTFQKRFPNGFELKFLSPLNKYRCFSNPFTAVVSSYQPVKSLWQPDLNTLISALKNFIGIKLSNEEKAIEDIFRYISCLVVSEELQKWFVLGLIGNGKKISELTPNQLDRFACELPLIVRAIYNYHRSTIEEASNDLRHSILWCKIIGICIGKTITPGISSQQMLFPLKPKAPI